MTYPISNTNRDFNIEKHIDELLEKHCGATDPSQQQTAATVPNVNFLFSKSSNQTGQNQTPNLTSPASSFPPTSNQEGTQKSSLVESNKQSSGSSSTSFDTRSSQGSESSPLPNQTVHTTKKSRVSIEDLVYSKEFEGSVLKKISEIEKLFINLSEEEIETAVEELKKKGKSLNTMGQLILFALQKKLSDSKTQNSFAIASTVVATILGSNLISSNSSIYTNEGLLKFLLFFAASAPGLIQLNKEMEFTPFLIEQTPTFEEGVQKIKSLKEKIGYKLPLFILGATSLFLTKDWISDQIKRKVGSLNPYIGEAQQLTSQVERPQIPDQVSQALSFDQKQTLETGHTSTTVEEIPKSFQDDRADPPFSNAVTVIEAAAQAYFAPPQVFFCTADFICTYLWVSKRIFYL